MSEVRNDTAQNRFELDVDGEQAVAYYRMTPGVITFVHTRCRRRCRAAGSERSSSAALSRWCGRRGLKVVPQCPFVSAFMGKHPEYNDLLH